MEAIRDVKWLDNNTVAFVGEYSGSLPQQVYIFNCTTKELKSLTHHDMPVNSYSVTSGIDTVIFSAKSPTSKFGQEKIQRNGIVVTTQFLPYLLGEDHQEFEITWSSLEKYQLFVERGISGSVNKIDMEDELPGMGLLSLSPNGKYAVVEVLVRNVPEKWSKYEYDDPTMQSRLAEKRPKGTPSSIVRYALIDIARGSYELLIDAPHSQYSHGIAWAPDSKSVIVSGVYLPSNNSDHGSEKPWNVSQAVVEVRLPSREVVKLTSRDMRVIEWNANANAILLGPSRFKKGPNVSYRRDRDSWREVESVASGLSVTERLDIVLDEGLNNPPRLLAVDTQTGKKTLLLDLNPQFGELNFGKVEDITWSTRDGRKIRGGLYYPPDYVSGVRYPLVIQTHGFDTDKFWIDGPFTVGFAAQALAGKGLVVLQVMQQGSGAAEAAKAISTPQEGPLEMAGFEGAIDYLDSIGLINRNYVGIIGFSRTSFHVKYTLTHSKYRFAAATVISGIDGGYFQYVVSANALPRVAAVFEDLNGGVPVGDGLVSWLNLSPGFKLDKVQTPLRIEAIGRYAILQEWEWFSVLSSLGRPVDMVIIPDGAHVLEKPWDRVISQQGNVDWYSFWLLGEEDQDPSKREQYARWRQIRESAGKNQFISTPAR
jgi:dipeptidyl aminopeptidase/acylaminoacyl peptidase